MVCIKKPLSIKKSGAMSFNLKGTHIFNRRDQRSHAVCPSFLPFEAKISKLNGSPEPINSPVGKP